MIAPRSPRSTPHRGGLGTSPPESLPHNALRSRSNAHGSTSRTGRHSQNHQPTTNITTRMQAEITGSARFTAARHEGIRTRVSLLESYAPGPGVSSRRGFP